MGKVYSKVLQIFTEHLLKLKTRDALKSATNGVFQASYTKQNGINHFKLIPL